MAFTAVIAEPSCLLYSTFNFVVKLFNKLTASNMSNLPGIYVCTFSERFISTVYFSRTDFSYLRQLEHVLRGISFMGLPNMLPIYGMLYGSFVTVISFFG